MKTITKSIATLLLILMLAVTGTNLYAQPGGMPTAPKEDPSLGGTNGAVGHQLQGASSGATLTSGMWLLLLLGGAYGGYKLYQVKRAKGELSE